jgi:geranylgeranyl pyrophosphate synthase
MDLAGDPAETGKPTGSDARQGKMTLAIIEALRRESGDEADAVRAAITSGWSDTGDADRIRTFAERVGGVAYAWRSAAEYLTRARATVNGIAHSPARDALLTLCGEGFPLPVMA